MCLNLSFLRGLKNDLGSTSACQRMSMGDLWKREAQSRLRSGYYPASAERLGAPEWIACSFRQSVTNIGD